MATIYQGDEKKFAIELSAPGFDIDTDDFDLEVKSPKASIKASKGAPTEELKIFYEEEERTVPPAEEGGQPTTVTVKQWYGIVDTTTLTSGTITVIATAHITDANASGGIRCESAEAVLGTLKLK